MAWVVKELRVEALEELRRDAQRDARRTRRRADRARAEVAAALDELAVLATELRATVQRQRMAACPPTSELERGHANPAGPRVVATLPAPETAPVPQRAARRGGRASLHASPLLELFRATGPAGQEAAAIADGRGAVCACTAAASPLHVAGGSRTP